MRLDAEATAKELSTYLTTVLRWTSQNVPPPQHLRSMAPKPLPTDMCVAIQGPNGTSRLAVDPTSTEAKAFAAADLVRP